VLKAMVDAVRHKKIMGMEEGLFTGISTGRVGNLRGMDQITVSS